MSDFQEISMRSHENFIKILKKIQMRLLSRDSQENILMKLSRNFQEFQIFA